MQAVSRLRSWGRAACRMAPQFWAQPLTLLGVPPGWEHSAPRLAADWGLLRHGLATLALQ